MRCRVRKLLQVSFVIAAVALITATASSTESDASQDFAPFSCDGTVYYALNNVTPGKTQLTTYNRDSSSFQIIGDPQPRHNSLAFNPVDGFLYSVIPNTTEIFRIGANGNVISLWLPLGDNPGGAQWVSGAFLPDGKYVMIRNPLDPGGGYIMVVDGIMNNRPVVIRGQPFEPNTTDIAYNPADGLLYSFDRDGDVQQWLTIDPETFEYNYFGVSSDFGAATGGIAFNADGTLLTVGLGEDENEGLYAIYSIDLDPESPSYGAFTLYDLSNEPSSGSDAASCYY